MKRMLRISLIGLLALGMLTSCAKSEKLSGVWTSEDNLLYPVLEFKGESTVVIQTILGPFCYGYERDGEFIRIRTDQSNLLFELEGKDRLVGTGWAEGVWIKENKTK